MCWKTFLVDTTKLTQFESDNLTLTLIDQYDNYTQKESIRFLTRDNMFDFTIRWEQNNSSYKYFTHHNELVKKILDIIRTLITCITAIQLCFLFWYYELEMRLLVAKKHLDDGVTLFSSPLRWNLILEIIATGIHRPTFLNTRLQNEFQLTAIFRLYHIVKFLREHHPMRYHRMTEILKTVASVKLSSTFLIKSYFMKKPLVMLLVIYGCNIILLSYVVYVLERKFGKCYSYMDSIWLLVVTATNLGYGDIVVHYPISRFVLTWISMFGILQMALLVGVISEALVLPPDEKRILASVEKQRSLRIRRNAAALLIQVTWRRYKVHKAIENDSCFSEDEDCFYRNSPVKLVSNLFKARWSEFELSLKFKVEC